MDQSRENRIRELFDGAYDLPPSRRAEFLAQACPDDPALAAEVESLLVRDADPDTTLDRPLLSDEQRRGILDAALGEAFPELEGSVGPYRIIRKIADGGMGAVFEARQEHPDRVVALKVLRPAMVSRKMLQRFALEAEVLGRLRHPGIAQIYEAGTAETRFGPCPFFAMEYLVGSDILRYAQEHKLDVTAKLDLIARVCDAVHHAHQQGIVHRDLKPDNILVIERGDPKVLDFGVARATDMDIFTATLQTSKGQLIGTVPYMSPEQAAGNPDDIDIRSDVYAIGVVAYELLCGDLPYEVRDKLIHEAVRIIQDVPPRPLGLKNRALCGDVETIIGKALAKEKERRYAAASELAADIRRYLAHDPIVARQPSVMYQLRRFSQRHRGIVAMSAMTLVMLLAAILIISNFAWHAEVRRIEAEEQRGLAQSRLVEANDARDEAEQQRELAQQRLIAAEAARLESQTVSEFLQTLLASGDPAEGGRELTVREVLDRAADRLERDLAGQPRVRGVLEHTLAQSYSSLGLAEPAMSHARRAFDLRRDAFSLASVEAIEAGAHLADLLTQADDLSGAGALLDDLDGAMKGLSAATGELEAADAAAMPPPSEPRASARADSPDNATPPAEQPPTAGQNTSNPDDDDRSAAARVAEGAPSPQSDDPMLPLRAELARVRAVVLRQRGQFPEAETAYREALDAARHAHPGDHADISKTLNGLGLLLLERGRYAEARDALQESLDMRRRLFGENHPSLATPLVNLAGVRQRLGDLPAAEALYDQALAVRREALGPDHMLVGRTLFNLATLRHQQGRLDEAAAAYDESVAILRENYPPGHSLLITARGNWAALKHSQGDARGARDLTLEVLDARRGLLGDEHVDVARDLNNLSVFSFALMEFDAAQRYARESLTQRRKLLGDEHSATIMSMHDLAMALIELGRPQEAHALMSEALAAARKTFPEGSLAIAEELLGLGWAKTQWAVAIRAAAARDGGGATDDSNAAAEAAGEGATDPGYPADAATADADGASSPEPNKLVTDAEALIREGIEIRQTQFAEDHWRLAEAHTFLGACLAAAGRYDEAEPILRASFETLRDARGIGDIKTQMALRELIVVCKAAQRLDDADAYRQLSTLP